MAPWEPEVLGSCMETASPVGLTTACLTSEIWPTLGKTSVEWSYLSSAYLINGNATGPTSTSWIVGTALLDWFTTARPFLLEGIAWVGTLNIALSFTLLALSSVRPTPTNPPVLFPFTVSRNLVEWCPSKPLAWGIEVGRHISLVGPRDNPSFWDSLGSIWLCRIWLSDSSY